MPKKAKPLTAYQLKRISNKPGLHAVGGVAGLQLRVKPETGSCHWILRTMVGSRRRDFGLGGYPDVSLEGARRRAREMREQIARGIDPVDAKRAAKEKLDAAAAKRLTFRLAAQECFAARQPEFTNARHRGNWISSLERYAFPTLGSLPVDQIEAAHVARALQPIWLSKTATAQKVRQRIEAVLDWSTVAKFRTGDNPAQWRGSLEHVLAKPSKVHKVKHHRAIPHTEIGAFMARLQSMKGIAGRALEFAILTAARSGEVRLATWSEFDFVANRWSIPAERMKGGRRHVVPLSRRSLALLRALPRMEGSEYVFPAPRGGALSDMALSAVTRRMEVDAVPHGFRSTFKDWCRTSTSYADEVSELALAHVGSDATRAAYARDELLEKRSRLLEEWATYCYRHTGGEVVGIREANG